MEHLHFTEIPRIKSVTKYHEGLSFMSVLQPQICPFGHPRLPVHTSEQAERKSWKACSFCRDVSHGFSVCLPQSIPACLPPPLQGSSLSPANAPFLRSLREREFWYLSVNSLDFPSETFISITLGQALCSLYNSWRLREVWSNNSHASTPIRLHLFPAPTGSRNVTHSPFAVVLPNCDQEHYNCRYIR